MLRAVAAAAAAGRRSSLAGGSWRSVGAAAPVARASAAPAWSTAGGGAVRGVPSVLRPCACGAGASGLCDVRWASTTAAAAASAPPAVASHAVVSGVEVPPDSVGRLFAVVRMSGTQYKVTEGDVVVTDKIPEAEVGTVLEVDDVLLVGSRDKTVVGRPQVPQARVKMFVEEQTLDQKVIVFKKKRRKGYKRKQGHRREITVLRVQSVELDGM
mmetsp:Transcript_20609/g.72777  ORF Transcript_20609/g.72777 Transcript_20609/m.72777 type:complete len:213 (-) Transcript_20609:70-708(-)